MSDTVTGAPATILCQEAAAKMKTEHQERLAVEGTEIENPTRDRAL